MSTIVQRVRQLADAEFKRMRWSLGLSGAASVLFGIIILVWPQISLYTLVLLFGAFALVRGIFGLVAALGGSVTRGHGWLVFSSLAGVATGVLVFFWTDMSALALLYVIGAYAIALGIITVGSAFGLLLDTADRILLTVTGLVSILFGIVMLTKPGDGALVLLALIAAYSLVIGFAELIVAISGRRLLSAVTPDSPKPPQTQTSH